MKRNYFLKVLLLFLLFISSISFGHGESSILNLNAAREEALCNEEGPTVTTDKDDYFPGEYVIITGTGWTPGEQVFFYFEETPKPETCILSHDYMATADENGNIYYDQFLIKENHLGVAFELTATGQSSGLTAVTLFTDANTKLTLTSPTSAPQGSTITLTAFLAEQNGSNLDTPIPGRTIYFYFNSIEIGSAVTNSNGIANLSYTISSTQNVNNYNGSNGLKAEFKSDPQNKPYAGSSDANNFEVTSSSCTTPSILTSNYQTFAADRTCGASVSMGSNIIVNSGTTPISYLYSLTNFGPTISNPYTFPIGTTTVYVKASNTCGNEIKSFTVTVTDNQLPTIICPPNKVVNNSPGECSAPVIFSVNATDNCGTPNITYSQASGTTFPIGTTTVNVTATDASNNKSNCSFTVTVVDNESPAITCPDNISVSNEQGQCGTVVTYSQPTYSDNCLNATISQTAGLASGSQFPIGTTNNTFRVTDAAGNKTDCSFTVTVVDNETPIITCPKNITVSNDKGSCDAEVNYDLPSYTDNCQGASIQRISGPASGSTFDLGTTTILFRVTDTSGNSADCSFTVTVSDNEDPSILCPSNISVSADPDNCGAYVDYEVSAKDNCGDPRLSMIQGLTSGSLFPVGETINTYQAIDARGNKVQCSFTVTVKDEVPPTVICQSATVQLDANGNASITASQIDNGSNDGCGIASLSLNKTIFDCSNVGPNSVTLTVIDNNGNTSTCTAIVTVEDKVAPIAICQSATVQLDAYGNASIMASQIDNGSNDACGIASLSLDKVSFDCSNVGPNSVTLTVTDINGNVSTCNTTVTVEDNVTPTVICKSATVQLDAYGYASITAEDIDNGSTDACGIASLSLDKTSFDCSNIGANTVTLIVIDKHGNKSTCSATVTVMDTILPTISCPVDVTINTDPNTCGAVYQFAAAADDNCGIASLTYSIEPGSVFEVGANEVTATATDVNGNSASCSFTITVIDVEAPVINYPSDRTLECGSDTSVASTGNAEATDNCGVSSITFSDVIINGTCPNNYSIKRTFTAKDVNGNLSSYTQTINIQDTQTPVISNLVAPTAPIQIGAAVNLSASYSDCSDVKATFSFSNDGTNFGSPRTASVANGLISLSLTDLQTNVYTVKVTATDACGNTTTVVYPSYLVIFDPAGGFVTGGGWIISPVNPSLPYMTVTGTANFGFVAKYKTGKTNSTEVDGNTNFQFKEGNFNFKSIVHENMSLVISGDKKATYRGLGTVNGSGSHYFVVTVIDGDAIGGNGTDYFRIVVYGNGTTSPSGQPIYDNEFNSPLNADATTAIGGGSIVIHKPAIKGKTSNLRLAADETVVIPTELNLSAWPNPSDNIFKLKLNTADLTSQVTVNVFDLSNKLVHASKISPNTEYSFGENLTAGIYILKVVQGQQTTSAKLVKF